MVTDVPNIAQPRVPLGSAGVFVYRFQTGEQVASGGAKRSFRRMAQPAKRGFPFNEAGEAFR